MAMPARIGRYRVLGVVGRGAMGVVYRGRDDSLDRDVALKLMRAAAGAEDRSRFLREARAAARLQHPNIVIIYEADEEDGEPFIAMELLEGMDLQRAIEAGLRPDPKVTLPIVLQLLAGLGHAHDQGIVHRDVKPSNLFLPRKRPAKIMDFGVAHLAGGSAAAGIVGTPNYMSPEQVRSGSVDGRSDVFSAGLILYELVTGEKAYRGDSVVTLLYKIAHEDADLSLLPRGEEWARLREVLATSLARDPEQRYPSAGHMHDQLSLAFRDLGGGADWKTASDRGVLARSGSPRAASTPLAAERTAASPVTVPAPRAASPSAGLALAAAAGLAVLAAGGLLLLRTRRPPEASTPVTSLASSAPPLPATTPRTLPSSAPTPSPPPAMPPPASPSPSVRVTPREPPPAGEETPAPVAGRVDRANDLLEKGRFAAALAEARAVLRRDPGNAEAKMIAEEAEAATVVETRLKDARAALKRGDRDAALAEVRAGLAVSPNDARLLALFRELVRQ